MREKTPAKRSVFTAEAVTLNALKIPLLILLFTDGGAGSRNVACRVFDYKYCGSND